MLPPRPNGRFFSTCLVRDRRDWSGKLDWKWPGHREVVETPVGVLEREHELRRREFAREPHDDAIN